MIKILRVILLIANYLQALFLFAMGYLYIVGGIFGAASTTKGRIIGMSFIAYAILAILIGRKFKKKNRLLPMAGLVLLNVVVTSLL